MILPIVQPFVQNVLLKSLLGRVFLGAVAIIGSIRYGTGLYFWKVTEQLERPQYQILERLSYGVEIRQYEPYMIAETTIKNSTGFDRMQRTGFQTCASYIFGNNIPSRSNNEQAVKDQNNDNNKSSGKKTGEVMSMTAPVRMSGNTMESSTNNKNKSKMSFVIGSKYKMNDVPKPIDSNIKIRQLNQHVLAVRTFSGPTPTSKRIKMEREKIIKALLQDEKYSKNNIKKYENGETLMYGYHDPFITPNILRRNEVAILLNGKV